MTRGGGVLVVVVAALVAVGCGSGTGAAEPLTAAKVVAELNALHPAPDPQDRTRYCDDGEAPCLQGINTDAVTVYQYADEAAAARAVAEGGNSPVDEQVGQFVLSYYGRESKTSAEVKRSWAARVRELVDSG